MNKILRFVLPFIVACLSLYMLYFLISSSSEAQASDDLPQKMGVEDEPMPAEIQADLLVTTLEDELNADGDCSLREAIEAANTNAAMDACPAGDAVYTDTITFEVAGTITVTNQLSVTAGGPLVIDGGDVITVSGGNNVRVLYIEIDARLGLENMTVTGGFSGFKGRDHGGGIYNLGILSIAYSTLSGNFAIWGGGIYNEGTLNITDSNFSDNSAVMGGGIINLYFLSTLTIANSTFSSNHANDSGGGIYNNGTMTITNSTLSGNYSHYFGGGIFNYYSTESIVNNTFSGNSAGYGGGIYINHGHVSITNSTFSANSAKIWGGGIYSNGTLTITNSIIANSLSGGDCYGPVNDGGHNIDSDGGCDLDEANSSLPDTDPWLEPLYPNGGSTWTHALFWRNSPAIDAGDNAQCPPTDQRGIPRPLDGDGDGQNICDIGSFELIAPIPVPSHEIYLPLINRSTQTSTRSTSSLPGGGLLVLLVIVGAISRWMKRI